jgi:hypothetical protein
MAEVLALSPAERIELAFALGEADLALFVRASGLDRETALARLRASRRTGRRLSRAAAGD